MSGCQSDPLPNEEVDRPDSGPPDVGPGADQGEAPEPIEGLTPYPGGCDVDADCADRSCQQGICVPAPPGDRPAEYSCDDAPRPGTVPTLTCWGDPPPLASGPAMVAGQGLVEFFGEGDKTVGLRVRIYDFERFDPSECAEAGARERGVIGARDAVEACLDAALDAQPDRAPLVDTVTVECDPPQPDSGCWSAPALPTGRPLVARVTGESSVWVPTYQYGLVINPCDSPAARFDSGVCPESVGRPEPGLSWACSLVTDPSPFHATSPAAPYWFRNLSVISQRTWDSFPQTAGEVRINRGLGAVAGRLYDCSGRSVVNATFALARPGPRDTYFNGDASDTLPSPGRTSTNLLGTYANLNTPPGPNGMAAVARVGAATALVAFERFYLLPDTVTIVNPAGRSPVMVEPPY